MHAVDEMDVEAFPHFVEIKDGSHQEAVARFGRMLIQLIATGEPGLGSTWAQALYVSEDDGRSWERLSQLERASEPHLLEIEPGRIMAALRYQRDKTPEDPPNLATAYDLDVWLDFAHGHGAWTDPTEVGVRIYQHTALACSYDGGRTWSPSRIVTGLTQQSASLVRLSDGTLVLVFGRPGQRFMLSYDQGETWSRAVYQLHHTGEYARAAALADDTIVVIHDFGHYMHYAEGEDRLGSLRFRVPPREQVEAHGFFRPREIGGC